MMRFVVLTLAFAQALLPKSSPLQLVTVTTSASAQTVAKGNLVTLWADVTPKANIHVYATDREGLTPVALTLTPRNDIRAAKAKYPAGEMSMTAGTAAAVPVYRKPFRIAQPVTISSKSQSGDVTITGVLNYQACDDKLCYPSATLPVSWTLTVK